jgi:hypothetical protein
MKKRAIFSVNIPDTVLHEYVTGRAEMHPCGISGYFRDLISQDRKKWQESATLRDQALNKLTAEERAALGYHFKP